MTARTFIARHLRRAAGLVLGFTALALAVTGMTPVTARAEAAKPPMWVITDADSTLYLLGTIHIMKPGTDWRTGKVETAFNESGSLWLEFPDMDDTDRMLALMQTYGIDQTRPVTEGLPPEDITRLTKVMEGYGVGMDRVMPLRKWLLGVTLVQLEARRLGYDMTAGVDITLLKQAKARGMPVSGLETAEEQIRTLAAGTEEEELKSLRSMLSEIGKTDNTLDRLFTVWTRGDEAALDAEMNTLDRETDPALYRRILTDRNARWVPRIETILAGKGIVFIAVGAGHLVGKDSVIAMLKARGIQAERVH